MQAERLAEWISAYELSAADLLPEAGVKPRPRVHDFVLDYLGVLLAGAAREESARVALADAREAGGPEQATLFVSGAPRVSAEAVAFGHGVAAHSIEMDDVHNGSSLHPAVVVIPPAMAVAEERGQSGRDLLEAIVVGYEVAIRVGEIGHPSRIYARGFHPTPVCGIFGSAAAAARLMGLAPAQIVNALGIAWSFAAGNMSFQAEGSWAKRLQVGHAARCGVQAARLAKRGATGPAHVFEAHGFFHGYAGIETDGAGAESTSRKAPPFDPEALTRDLGERLRIFETGIKPYACCRYNQTPLDCLLELRQRHQIDPAAIESVDVEIASTGLPLVAVPLERKQSPRDPVEAQFSLPYSAAVALVAGEAGPDQYVQPWLGREDVRSLARRVRVGSSAKIDAQFPARWPSRVKVRLKDGRELEAYSENCLGDPAKPLSKAQLVQKFETLTGGILSSEARQDVLDRVERLAELERAAELTTALA